MAFWREWVAARDRRGRAAAYVAVLCADPSPEDVAWLAANATHGDADHARWELRYARRALGLIVAQRDALDDRTASLVAKALADALSRDPGVAPDKRHMAEQQLSARLRAYSEAIANRGGDGTASHLGSTLLGFAGRRDSHPAPVVSGAAAILSRYMGETNAALREAFGAAALPDDVAPSRLRAQRS
jgi:hypothetical protein